MSTKPTGLAAFTRKAASVQPEAHAAAAQPATAVAAATVAKPVQRRRQRGQGDTVSLTVRLTRADWERVHQLAVSEGTSIQQLATVGLSKVFAERGLPALTE